MKIKLIIALTILPITVYCQLNSKKQISIFTDGNSYVSKTIKVKPTNKVYTIKGSDIPNARMGTLWIADKSNSVKSIVSYIDTIDSKPLKSASFTDLLNSNIGNAVTVNINQSTFSGKIKEVYGSNYLHLDPLGTENSMNWQFINIKDIISLSFNKDPQIEFTSNPSDNRIVGIDTERNIEIEFSNSSEKEVGIEYLQKGISWKPFYYLDIESKNKARLKIQAEVINDSEKIVNTDVHFVVGVPNFRYSDYLTDLIDFKNRLDPFYESNRPDRYNNGVSLDEVVITGTNDENKKFHDFHIYTKNNLNLRKNSRAIYKLSEHPIEFKHIYECDLIQYIDYTNTYNSNNQNVRNKVYHSLKFKNDTGNLFGEGSIIMVDKSKGLTTPLAQDKLNFTASGATAIVKITESPEIEISHRETVLERSTTPTKFWGREYYRAKVKGVITIENYKDEKLDLELRYSITGEVKELGDNSEILFQKQPAFNLNQLSKVQWSISLNKMEKKEVEYEFDVYVNR